MKEENKIHRRQVIGGLGATLAAAAVTPGFASPGKKIKGNTAGSYKSGYEVSETTIPQSDTALAGTG